MKLAITLLKQKEYDIKNNLNNAAEICRSALEDNADIVLLPEYFNLGLNTEQKRTTMDYLINFLNKSYSRFYYPPLRQIVRFYASYRNIIATDLKKYLKPITEQTQSYNKKFIIGSIPLKDGKHVYNTGFIINSNGEIFFKQKKLHPYDYELHMVDPHNILETTRLKGFNTAITICWDSLEGEMETAINKGAQLVLSPTLFTTYASALEYSHQRAEHLKKYIYFACSTIIPQNEKNRISGGGFILGPDINSTRHSEGYMIENINTNKLRKPGHKLKRIMLEYNNNPHFDGYASLSKSLSASRYNVFKEHERFIR